MRRARDDQRQYRKQGESGSSGRRRRLLISIGACLLVLAVGWYRGTWAEAAAVTAALVVGAWLSAQAMRWLFLAAALFESGWLLAEGLLDALTVKDAFVWPIAVILLVVAMLLPSLLGREGPSPSGDQPSRGRGGGGGPSPAPVPAVPLPPRRTLSAVAEAEPDDEAGPS